MLCFACGKEIEEGLEEHHGLHPSCFRSVFGTEGLSEFTGIARLFSGTDSPGNPPAGRLDVVSSFFQGKFRKYDARLGELHYILKVEEKEYHELPVVEYLCNQIARALEIRVPGFQLIRFHGASSLAVRNFIRPGRREALHHIYHFLEGGSLDCEMLMKVIGERTGRLIEVERFVMICLFDSLIGNHDRHGRNLALVEEPGAYRLAPFYDNASYLGMEEDAFLSADHSPRGRIATAITTEPLMSDYIVEFRRLGYGDTVAAFRRRVDEASLMELIGWRFLSPRRAEAFRRLIIKRTGQLHHD